MKMLGSSGGEQWRGAVFTEQACFHLPSLQVTAQCSLIGSDCQTVFHLMAKKTPASEWWSLPLLSQNPFSSVFESGGSCSWAISPQAHRTNLTLTYENGLLSTFTSSLVLLLGHLLRSTRSCFAWARRWLIIFAVAISATRLLVHAKFNEELFDTCLIYMTQWRPGPRLTQTTQTVLWNEFCSHLLKWMDLLNRYWPWPRHVSVMLSILKATSFLLLHNKESRDLSWRSTMYICRVFCCLVWNVVSSSRTDAVGGHIHSLSVN